MRQQFFTFIQKDDINKVVFLCSLSCCKKRAEKYTQGCSLTSMSKFTQLELKRGLSATGKAIRVLPS